jgi:Lipocalin-like domain
MTSVTGTWRLVRAVARDAEGRELPVPYGGQPMGRLALGADGRMAAVTCDARRQIPNGGEREYSSYCGNYSFDGTRLVTRVDAASDPARLASDQVREVSFEGELMVLRPPLRSYGGSPEQRILYWEKIADV